MEKPRRDLAEIDWSRLVNVARALCSIPARPLERRRANAGPERRYLTLIAG